MAERYFLYARKSTDVEDKQVLSIEAQLTELRVYAKQEDIEIVDELVEKQSAKIPGRPIFGQLLKRIEAGEASGILSWHPDRLARNSIDGGQIIYLLDCGQLNALKFPTFWFENTSQGKFMLSIAFGQSKYYVDNLSENTKRGLRQKVRRGEYPSFAPLGYINDMRNKSIIVEQKKSVAVREAFELYAENNSRLEDISNFLAEQGILTSGSNKLKKDQIKRILANPFYYGHFRYNGELYEGKHEPIITKKLFDDVQTALAIRGRPRKNKQNEPKVFCGLLHCGSCNLMITGEKRIKTQKNGNIHEYIYYHCTKKRKDMQCSEPHIRQEELDIQLSDLLKAYAMPDDWAQDLRTMLNKDERQEQKTSNAFIATAQEKVQSRQTKLQRLLDGYLDQDIDRETYVTKKAELLSQKKSLQEQIAKLTYTNTAWVEPMRAWINKANALRTVSTEDNLQAKKVAAKEIFGSNLILKNKQARFTGSKNNRSPLKQQWVALRASLHNSEQEEKSRLMAGEKVP
jgi:site-specific DNA recombinase